MARNFIFIGSVLLGGVRHGTVWHGLDNNKMAQQLKKKRKNKLAAILKMFGFPNMTQEGRIGIILLSVVYFIGMSDASKIDILWLKLLSYSVLSLVWYYAATYISKKYEVIRFNKLKGGTTNGRRNKRTK